MKQPNNSLSIRILESSDIPIIVNAFQKANWPKPAILFETYLQEQQHSERLVWVCHMGEDFIGYVTLKWQSQYAPFASANIPEVMDLNVLPPFRKAGGGAMLLAQAELAALAKSDVIGLGVGLYGGPDGGYGAAQKLYVKNGYIPDGKGVTYNYEYATPGDSFPLDDDLIMWLTKKLR